MLSGVLMKRGPVDTDTGGMPCAHAGRDWAPESTSPGTPKIASKVPQEERRVKRFSLTASEGANVVHRDPDFRPPPPGKDNLLPLRPPRSWGSVQQLWKSNTLPQSASACGSQQGPGGDMVRTEGHTLWGDRLNEPDPETNTGLPVGSTGTEALVCSGH